ncbi:MAG: hypothetical protein BroJett002_30570 [Candidatus Brocadia sinica]|nr:MAG: hypothetical protein BroJett002_30570 [Candidatus Brocadia sinica]
MSDNRKSVKNNNMEGNVDKSSGPFAWRVTNNSKRVIERFTVISKSRKIVGIGIISTTNMPITPTTNAISPCENNLPKEFLIM